MITVMSRLPILATNITELVLASACHVVATLALFDNKIASLALSILQVILKVIEFLVITWPAVLT